MNTQKTILGSALAAFVLLAFVPPGKNPFKYINKDNMDFSVKPGDNFYQYANGGWLAKNPVPASKTRWGSFDELRTESTRRLRDLLESASKQNSAPQYQKVVDMYFSGMDSVHLNQIGYEPVKADIQRINAISDVNDLLKEYSYERVNGIGSSLFGFGVSPDRKNVTVYRVSLSQGGTSLPSRDYYIKADPRSQSIRTAYAKHLTNMFMLFGDNKQQAQAEGDAVMRIETALARAQKDRVEMRDPYKTYNKLSQDQLQALTSGIEWKSLFKQLGLSNNDSVVVDNPDFLRSVDLLLAAVPLDNWKSYFKWNVMNGAAGYLGDAFVSEKFDFNKVLSGQKMASERWELVSGVIDRSMGDLIGKMYVDKYFKPEAKARMLELVNNLQATFAERIRQLDWMSEDTKVNALQKLNAFTKKIAYPDTWRDYAAVSINRNDYLGNARRLSVAAYNEMIARYGKPVDRTRWAMTPPTINAYYNSSSNEIVFPAGILQFPFFDFGADDAVNYGGIGAVIGHEMTHGFDDQGSKFADDGNLKNWWTETDRTQFESRTTRVVNQYNAFTVLDTIHVNGKLTLGENLADLGGLSIAYDAFTKTRQFKQGKKIDGFTPAQRFFLSWAQVWRNNQTPESEAQLILVDPHSPGEHRTNGPLVNIDAWYNAFDVQPGQKMYVAPDSRIRIW